MKRILDLALRRPWLTVFLSICFSWILINPLGNYALNDDWTFAHFAKHIAEFGKFERDAPSSPTVVGQAWIGAIVIKIFGFHYFTLRLATLSIFGLGLWTIDFILRRAKTSAQWRLFGLACFAFNPIVYYSTASFMTELWGWLPPLLGVALWHWDANRHSTSNRLTSHWVPPVAGFIIGLGFLTRQFAVLLMPAVVGAEILAVIAVGNWQRILRSVPAIAVGFAVMGATVSAYFSWAKATNNFSPEFAERIGHLTMFNGNAWIMQSGSAILYMTAFFLPFLILFRWKSEKRWLWDLSAAGLLLLLFSAQLRFREQAPSDFWIGPIWTHKVFPYVVNIIWNAGLGPITLDDGFFYDAPKPTWPKVTWTSIETVLMMCSLLWVSVGAQVFRRVKARVSVDRLSVLLFGVLLTCGCVVSIVQTHQNEVVDRYYLPLILGSTFLFVSLCDGASKEELSLYPYRLGVAALALLGLGTFSILGSHDQFRWNDARWSLIEKARSLGGNELTIQAGYEANCWWKHEGVTNGLSCEGGCRCVYNGFCCADDRFRVGMSVSPSYVTVESVQPNYWLTDGPAVVLTRRQ
jgi:hypothetical protein